MRDVTSANFGFLVAYLLPGFAALAGIGQLSEPVRAWLITPSTNQPTLGGFVYLTAACLACGLLISTFRWAILDTLHHRTGIREPRLKFGTLEQRLPAFQLLVESHYRYYQFYANMVLALGIAFVAWGVKQPDIHRVLVGLPMFLVVEASLFLGSRDTLRKYYRRSEELLSS